MERTAAADSTRARDGSRSTIRAVIFDFGGVLCFHPTDEQIARAAAACGLSATEFLNAFWSNRIPHDAGQVDPKSYWNSVAATAGIRMDDALLARMMQADIDFWSRYDRRVISWATALRAEGLRIGILSNLPRPLGNHLRADSEFIGHFDQVTFSCELGVIKPQAAIYEDAIRGLGVPPEQALFLDDRQDNVDGARAVGMNAELYASWETFVESGPARYALPVPAVARRQ
jgi:putative hydrolase of the HAD superfamily